MSLEHLDLFIHVSGFLASQGTMNMCPEGENLEFSTKSLQGLATWQLPFTVNNITANDHKVHIRHHSENTL
jgi:hypothetical protein